MSILDRFTSHKGKAAPAAPKKPAKVSPKEKEEKAKKETFQAVPKGDAEKSKAPVAAKKSATDQAFRILRTAVVTEKSSLIGKHSQVVFRIAPNATKMDVRNAVQQVYGVRPVAVNIVRLPGKVVRYGRNYGRQAVRKKAVVALPAGKSIDVVSA